MARIKFRSYSITDFTRASLYFLSFLLSTNITKLPKRNIRIKIPIIEIDCFASRKIVGTPIIITLENS